MQIDRREALKLGAALPLLGCLPELKVTEPALVFLLDDYLVYEDENIKVEILARTVLRRLPTGQYAPEDAKVGDRCVWGYEAFDSSKILVCDKERTLPSGHSLTYWRRPDGLA